MTTPVNPVFAGSSSLSSLTEAMILNPNSFLAPTSISSPDRFWSSAKRSINSTVNEILEVDLSTASLINLLTFDMVRFPQTLTIEYAADNLSDWQPVLNAFTKKPVSVKIFKSVPGVLPAATSIPGHSHPQHDFIAHWERVEVPVVPSLMQKIRFIITRLPAGSPPRDSGGIALDYSVALQNIDIGYRIASYNDIPRTLLEDDSSTMGRVFANSEDLFGSNLGFAKHSHKARSIIDNTDTQTALVWRSEPQPYVNSVVNLYADLRDNDGNGQVVDRIFIDPLHEGSHLTLYYSNDETKGAFVSSREALSNRYANFFDAGFSTNKLSWDLSSLDVTEPKFILIDNTYVAFDPSSSWWLGMEFTLGAGFAEGFPDSSNRPLFDCGAFQIGFTDTSIYLTTAESESVTLPIPPDPISPIQLIASYDPNTLKLHLSMQQQEFVTSEDEILVYKLDSVLPANLTIGSNTDQTAFASSLFSAFILNQALLPGDGFLDNPLSYSRVPLYPSDEGTSGYNALLRFDPTLTSATSPTGLVGGPAFNYENLVWTPIPREYGMFRGTMILPTTKAKFWKFEITNLRPEYSEKFIPVTRTTKLFPADIVSQFPDPSTSRFSLDDVGTDVQNRFGHALSFTDIPQYVGTGKPINGYTSTEVYTSKDPDVQERLSTLGSQWKYTNWHPEVIAPRFTKVGTHNYIERTVTQTTHFSFFAGLKEMIFFRNLKTPPQDHSFIEETFIDNEGIEDGAAYITNTGLTSGGSNSAQSVSVTMPTQRPLRGIQFATQQSAPQELDIAGDFNNADYDPAGVIQWTSVGDGRPLGLVSTSTDNETTLLVTRQTSVGYWADISILYSTWGGIKLAGGLQSNTFSPSYITAPDTILLPDLGIDADSIAVSSTDLLTFYTLGVDYDISQTDGNNIDSATSVLVRAASTIPPGVPFLVSYSYADATHLPWATYGMLSAGSTPPSIEGGIQSDAVDLPIGGRIYAAARVTSTDGLTEPLWLQIVDADTSNVLTEAQSNVGINDVKEWYVGLDVAQFGGSYGRTWADIEGKEVRPSFSDTFIRTSYPTGMGSLITGQKWSNPSADTPLTITSAGVASCGGSSGTTYRSEVDLQSIWGTLTVGVGTPVTTGTHASAVPLLDLGGVFLMNDSTFETNNTSATLATLSSSLAAGTYTFKFLPSKDPTSGASLDPVVFPYSIKITGPGIAGQTISYTRPFETTRALMGQGGGSAQTFTSFSWTPGTAQDIDQDRQIYSLPIPSSSEMVPFGSSSNFFHWTDSSTKRLWTYQGTYTYDSHFLANRSTSLNPSGTYVSRPLSVTATPSATGGNFVAGTYYWRITAYNSAGESTSSNEVSGAVTTNGSVALAWAASTGATGYRIYRSTTSNAETLMIDVGNALAYTDTGESTDTTIPYPQNNTTDAAGTATVTDVNDWFGSLEFNVTQMPASFSTFQPILAYLNYDPDGNFKQDVDGNPVPMVVTLRGDGTIYDEVNQATLVSSVFTATGATATGGPINIRYALPSSLSSGFKTTWGISDTHNQTIIITQNTTVLGVYSGVNIWDCTVRGIGGMNHGTTGTDYTIIEGFGWYSDATFCALYSADLSNPRITWQEVEGAPSSHNITLTYGQMRKGTLASSNRVFLRLLQKNPTADFWNVAATTLFWDAITWEFSCDDGVTWWEAQEIKNNPDGAILFPYRLTAYNKLKWRVTMYSPDSTVNNVVIRPWYSGMPMGIPPRPTQVNAGPNLGFTDHYTQIENDPRFKVWNKPIPRWWWLEFRKNHPQKVTN